MRILAFGTYQVANHPRIAVIMEGLRRRGHDVVEANVPLGLSTSQRVEMLGSKTGGARMIGRLASSWRRLAGAGLRARRGGGPDVVLVGYMGHFDVWLARLLFPRTTIALDHLIFASTTAADRGVGGSLTQRVLRLIDRSALRIADIVIVDTDEHAALVPASRASKVVVVPVGAPDAWFVEPAVAPEAAASVVFFGLFTPLQGAAVIGEAIALLVDVDVDFTMIGSGQDLDQTRRAAGTGARVTWLPWVDSAELPATVARHDIGLGIFGVTEKAAKVVPNKVFQCAAAGTAVVTSDTPPQRRLLGDSADFVPAGDAQALAATIRRLVQDPALLASRRRAARDLADAAFHPEQVVVPLARRLERA